MCSDTFDHTSVLRLIERRFGAEVPNLSRWRRSVTGDMTTAFNFAAPAGLLGPTAPADERDVTAGHHRAMREHSSRSLPGSGEDSDAPTASRSGSAAERALQVAHRQLTPSRVVGRRRVLEAFAIAPIKLLEVGTPACGFAYERCRSTVGQSAISCAYEHHWPGPPLHEQLYKRTDGRLGHRMIGVPTLLLRTTGRRSGATRTNGLVYARDGDDYLVVASNGGADRPPAWLHNLRANPASRFRSPASA